MGFYTLQHLRDSRVLKTAIQLRHFCLTSVSLMALINKFYYFVYLQLTKMNAEAQRVERALRDELADSISKAASNADRARIAELEKAEAELCIEVSKYV